MCAGKMIDHVYRGSMSPQLPVKETADHSSQSITSSADVKMSNWTAAEIQELQRLLGLCSCLHCPLVVVAGSY